MLAQAGIAVQSLTVHKPTLDDVFLSLTGKPKLAEVNEGQMNGNPTRI
jgi:hypothetical protein